MFVIELVEMCAHASQNGSYAHATATRPEPAAAVVRVRVGCAKLSIDVNSRKQHPCVLLSIGQLTPTLQSHDVVCCKNQRANQLVWMVSESLQ